MAPVPERGATLPLPAPMGKPKKLPGTKLKWFVNTATGTLHITGDGTLGAEADTTAWQQYAPYIERISLSEHVKSIDNEALFNLPALKELHMPGKTKVSDKTLGTDGSTALTISGGSAAMKLAKASGNPYLPTEDGVFAVKPEEKKITLPANEVHFLQISQPGWDGATFSYTSSDTHVATVSQEGVVISKNAGHAIITITSSHGESAEVKVKVAMAKKK